MTGREIDRSADPASRAEFRYCRPAPAQLPSGPRPKQGATRPQQGFLRALCCECGQLRYLSTRAGGKGGEAGEAGNPRCVMQLKCRHCARKTTHAYVRDFDDSADFAELSEEAKAQPYEPLTDAAERYAGWTFELYPLPEDVAVRISYRRRLVRVDPDEFGGDTDRALANAVAALDLGPGHMKSQPLASDDADGLALLRLGRMELLN